MNGEDSLLDQADALMRRQGMFVADTRSATEGARGLDNGGDLGLDDLPLLTEVVGTGPTLAADQQAAKDVSVDRLQGERRAALALALDKWLDEQLPQLVILAMDGITDHLVALITHRARAELMPLLGDILQPPDDSDRPG